MRSLVAIALLLGVVTLVRPALAQAADPSIAASSPVAEVPTRIWYGWQNLTVDGLVIGVGLPLTFVAAALDIGTRSSAPWGGVWAVAGSLELGGYAFGSSIVHLAHGHWGKAIGALGLRIGLPIAGVLFGQLVTPYAPCQHGDLDCRPSTYQTNTWMVLGGVLGVAGAIGLDAGVLARESVVGPKSPSPAAFHVVPALRLAKSGAVGGVEGTF